MLPDRCHVVESLRWNGFCVGEFTRDVSYWLDTFSCRQRLEMTEKTEIDFMLALMDSLLFTILRRDT